MVVSVFTLSPGTILSGEYSRSGGHQHGRHGGLCQRPVCRIFFHGKAGNPWKAYPGRLSQFKDDQWPCQG